MDDANIPREGPLNDSTMALARLFNPCCKRTAAQAVENNDFLYIISKLDGDSSQSLVDGMNNKGQQTGLSSFVQEWPRI